MRGGPTACCLRRSFRALRREHSTLLFDEGKSARAELEPLLLLLLERRCSPSPREIYHVLQYSCLFHAQAMLSPEMQQEMDDFKREEREAKAESKAEKARVKEEKSSQSTETSKTFKRAAGRVRRGSRS